MASSVPTRAGGSWIPDFRAKYEAWTPAALPLIRAHQYAEAFNTYPFQSIREPGGKLELPYRWEAPPVAWRGRELVEGP